MLLATLSAKHFAAAKVANKWCMDWLLSLAMYNSVLVLVCASAFSVSFIIWCMLLLIVCVSVCVYVCENVSCSVSVATRRDSGVRETVPQWLSLYKSNSLRRAVFSWGNLKIECASLNIQSLSHPSLDIWYLYILYIKTRYVSPWFNCLFKVQLIGFYDNRAQISSDHFAGDHRIYPNHSLDYLESVKEVPEVLTQWV